MSSKYTTMYQFKKNDKVSHLHTYILKWSLLQDKIDGQLA